MTEITHGRRIVTEKYYDGQLIGNGVMFEVEKFSDRNTMFKDVIDALAVITQGQTTKLELEICVDKKGRYLITRRWEV